MTDASVKEALKQLKQLLDDGLFSHADFKAEKGKVLSPPAGYKYVLTHEVKNSLREIKDFMDMEILDAVEYAEQKRAILDGTLQVQAPTRSPLQQSVDSRQEVSSAVVTTPGSKYLLDR